MIQVKFKNSIVCESSGIADTFFSRLKGLMFSSEIPQGDGLLIKRCNSIHTFFMNYDIDVIFLTDQYEVVKVIRKMSPWRASLTYFKASQVLEIYGGHLKMELNKGDQLEVICTN